MSIEDINDLINNQYLKELEEYENIYKLNLTDKNKEDIKRRITIEVKLWNE